MRDREAAVVRTAEQQFGVFSGSQAREVGYPRGSIHYQIERGAWVRVCGDTYRVAWAPEMWQQPIVGAWLAVGEPAAISSRSALAMWQLAAPSGCPEVTVPWTRLPRFRAARVVRTRRWNDIVRFGAVRLTSVPRTLLDIAPTIPERDLQSALDSAHRRRLIDLDRLAVYLGKVAPARTPGASTLSFLVGLHDAKRPIESEAETIFFRILRRAGLPAPIPQYPVGTRGGRRRLDFAYPTQRIGIEIDGYASHAGRAAFDDDRVRDNELADAGWDLRHVTWTMLTEQPGDIVWTIASALGLEPKGWRESRVGKRLS